MINVSRKDRKCLAAGSVKFSPLSFYGNYANNYRVRNTDDPNGITGQTALNRYPALFKKSIEALQFAKPERVKHVLSGPSSVGAQDITLAALAKEMGVLEQFRFESVDVDKNFIEHAKTFTLPKGMASRQPDWLKSAFIEATDADWVEVKDDLKNAIHIHDPCDLESFNGQKKYDIILICALFLHIDAQKQNRILENMIQQSSGLICLTHLTKKSGSLEEIKRRDEVFFRIGDIFRAHGFSFANHNQVSIAPGAEDMQTIWPMSNAAIAIHPDIADTLSF